MCGIAGFLGHSEGEVPLRRALGALAHRGPDDSGVLVYRNGCGPTVGLGSHRLAIIDLSDAAHQPMTSADGALTLVLNGEIYNHLELRSELERCGRRFRTHSDTEVLLTAWHHWGPSALDHLVGMFAFALLDRRTERLFLVRDRFGIKPLYHAHWNGGLAFASETDALLEFPGIGRGLNARRVHAFLTSMSTDFGSETMLTDVRQVPAAHYLAWDLHRSAAPAPVRYWRPDLSGRCDLSYQEAAARLRDLFVDSVRLHLRSDAPIGFALSGGIDSSAVVMVARELLGRDAPLHTFSYVSDHPVIGERRFSEHVAREAGSIAHPFTLNADDLSSSFDALIDAQGEPFPDPVIFAQYRLFANAREAGLKVVLTGEGADELLAGYDRFAPSRLVSLVRTGRWLSGAKLIRHSTRAGATRSRIVRSAARAFVPDPIVRATRWLRGRSPAPAWIHHGWFVERDGVSTSPRPAPGRATLREALLQSVEHVTLPALLRYQDRNAMAWSVENRVPFVTHSLAEFALSLPEEYLLSSDGTRKAIFRTAMEGIVPRLVLDRRAKIGFSTPAPHWLSELVPWIEDRLPTLDELPFLDADEVRRQWHEVRSRYSWLGARVVWRCICLAGWMKRRGVTAR